MSTSTSDLDKLAVAIDMIHRSTTRHGVVRRANREMLMRANAGTDRQAAAMLRVAADMGCRINEGDIERALGRDVLSLFYDNRILERCRP